MYTFQNQYVYHLCSSITCPWGTLIAAFLLRDQRKSSIRQYRRITNSTHRYGWRCPFTNTFVASVHLARARNCYAQIHGAMFCCAVSRKANKNCRNVPFVSSLESFFAQKRKRILLRSAPKRLTLAYHAAWPSKANHFVWYQMNDDCDVQKVSVDDPALMARVTLGQPSTIAKWEISRVQTLEIICGPLIMLILLYMLELINPPKSEHVLCQHGDRSPTIIRCSPQIWPAICDFSLNPTFFSCS